MMGRAGTNTAQPCAGRDKRKADDLSREQGTTAGKATDAGKGKVAKSGKSLASPPKRQSAGALSQMPTAQKEFASATEAAAAAAATADMSAEIESEWRTEGSAYVGRGILRTVQEDGQVSEGWGKITGWLSASESDFVNDDGKPAALWHVVFDDVALGEEDLEEHEVKAAVIAWELATRELARGGKQKSKAGAAGKGKKGKSKDAENDAVPPPRDPRVYFVEHTDENKGLPQLARELNVDVDEIIRLNSERYKGLKNASSCRLKAHTVLILPELPEASTPTKPDAAGSDSAGKDSTPPLNPPTGSAVATGARTNSPTSEPIAVPAPAPPKAPAMEPKAALMLLQNELNAVTNTTSVSAPTQSHSAGEAKRRSEEGTGEGVAHKGDWLMSMRPNLTFPPFPGVTEDMGVLAQEYLQHFCCPFIKKQGITYANAGFEAVAPVTAEVDDNWAECDACKKWRRLPGTFIVADGAHFQCSDADRSCEEPEDDWDDEEELEVENERGAVMSSALQSLDIEGLEVLNLGRIELSKGFWNEKLIFPVGYRSRRTYWDTLGADVHELSEKAEQKIQYECTVEMSDGEVEGPVFSVTPMSADGQLFVERRRQGDTASKAWSFFIAAREGGTGAAGGDPASKRLSLGDGVEDISKQEAGACPRCPVSAENGRDEGEEMCEDDEDGGHRSEVANGHWERDDNGCRTWVPNSDSKVAAAKGDMEMKEAGEVEGGEGGEGSVRKRAIVNGNLLFGLGHDKVKDLIRQLDGAEEISRSMQRWARRRQAGTLEERLKDMPSHLYQQQNKNVRVPVRNVKTRQYLIGDEAPRAKDIKKFLQENPTMECIDPSSFNRADEVMLEDYCKGLKLCYDCKKGMFANKNPTKFECRFKMLHSGPDWKKDPRTKSDKDKDPLSHLQHTRKFKTDYPPGTILKLDYNKNGEPTLLRMRTEFVQDALQVKLEWDEMLDEEGNACKQARLEKVDAPQTDRKLFTRPPWPPQLPEIPEGCARAAPRRVQSFTEKAEFTHHAKQSFNRLISHQEYKALDDSSRFKWMKENQNARLILGRSGIEGHGIFAKQPIYKGEMVVEYTGERVRPVVADVREEQYEDMGLGTYFWRLEDYLGAGEPPEGRASIVDATIRHNIGHYINHCCDPNCKASIMRINGQRKIIIAAEHDIQFGEEITYDYKLPLESKDKKIPCHCGALICKGTMN